MKPYLIVLALSFLFFSCGGSHSGLQKSFDKILHESESLEIEGIKNLITQKSIDYIEGLAKLSDSLDYDSAERFGKKHNIPLESMRLHAQSVGFLSNEEDAEQGMLKEDDADNIILLMKLTGTGILSMFAKERIKFHDAAVDGNTATVMAAVNTGVDKRTNILSSYKFRKEQGQWKVDIRSTMTLQEKLFKQMVQRKGGNGQAVIADYLENTPETMQFQYQYRAR